MNKCKKHMKKVKGDNGYKVNPFTKTQKEKNRVKYLKQKNARYIWTVEEERGQYMKDLIKNLKEALAKSTNVVSWYAHSYTNEVRGPWNRWFTCSKNEQEVLDGHVADAGYDCEYAAAAMNGVPELIKEYEELKQQADRLADVLFFYASGMHIAQESEQTKDNVNVCHPIGYHAKRAFKEYKEQK